MKTSRFARPGAPRGVLCVCCAGRGLSWKFFALVELLQVRLDPTAARFRRKQSLARVVFEREVLVGGRDEFVGESDEGAAFVASAFEEGADASEPEDGERLVVAARRGRDDAVRGVVALNAAAYARDRLRPVVLKQVPERDGQVRGVRPLGARQRAVIEAAKERKNLLGRAEGSCLKRRGRHGL